MTIIKQITQVRCDDCQRAYIYPEGDIDSFLRAHEWAVDDARHLCPCCARRIT